MGPETAGQLLETAGDNPEHLPSEAFFAHLCTASPIAASSGRNHRHRLNRGGDRQANRALHTIVLVRLKYELHAQTTLSDAPPTASPRGTSSGACSASSPAKSTACFPARNSPSNNSVPYRDDP
ncbi:transposase [Streptomyces sp. NPDC048489]|uniref:transposase n=1 Tax=Streptomyces sp. NPDC048489 TaxID=3154504 RepID=UPI0034210C2A